MSLKLSLNIFLLGSSFDPDVHVSASVWIIPQISPCSCLCGSEAKTRRGDRRLVQGFAKSLRSVKGGIILIPHSFVMKINISDMNITSVLPRKRMGPAGTQLILAFSFGSPTFSICWPSPVFDTRWKMLIRAIRPKPSQTQIHIHSWRYSSYRVSEPGSCWLTHE